MFLLELPKAINSLDFHRLKFKYTQTIFADMTIAEWDEAELAYRRFLCMKLIYPHLFLVPSKAANKIWQAHILDTRAYREDCYSIFGFVLDHYPYFGLYDNEDEVHLQTAEEKTNRLLDKHFCMKNNTNIK